MRVTTKHKTAPGLLTDAQYLDLNQRVREYFHNDAAVADDRDQLMYAFGLAACAEDANDAG
jgi:hypothetical protein